MSQERRLLNLPISRQERRPRSSITRLLCRSCCQERLVLKLSIIWLPPRAGKMNQIARCDWLPERARWSHLARSGLPAVSRKQNFTKSHIINPLLTKFVRSRWLDIGLVLFCEFMDLDFVSVHKHAKKNLAKNDPAILTSHLVNNPYIMRACTQFQCSIPAICFRSKVIRREIIGGG